MNALKIDDTESPYLLQRLAAWYEFITPLLPMAAAEMAGAFCNYLNATGFPEPIADVSLIHLEGGIKAVVVTVGGGSRISRTTTAILALVDFTNKRKLNEDPQKISDRFFTDLVLAAKEHYKHENVHRRQMVLAVYFHHYGIMRKLEATQFTMTSFLVVLRREMLLNGFRFSSSDEVNLVINANVEGLETVLDYIISYLALLPCVVIDGVPQYVKPSPTTYEELLILFGAHQVTMGTEA